MLSRPRLLVDAVALGLSVEAAQSAPATKTATIAGGAGQDGDNARLRVTSRAVAGATCQPDHDLVTANVFVPYAP